MSKDIFYIGELSHKLWYPFLASISYIGIETCDNFEEMTSEADKYSSHPFLYIFATFLSESLALPLYFYHLKTDKRTTIQNTPKENLHKVDYNYIKYILIICLISLCDLGYNSLSWVVLSTSTIIQNTSRGLFILFIALLCMKILDYKYYRHHYIAIGIMTIGYIFESFSNLSSSIQMNVFIVILLRIASNLLEALQDVFEKYLMEKKYVDPLLMLGLEGVIGMIITAIFYFFIGNMICSISTAFCTLNLPIDNFSNAMTFLGSHLAFLFIYIIQIFILFAYNLCRMLTNFHFSPAHRIISKIFRSILIWGLSYFSFYGSKWKNKNIFQIIIELISLILQSIGLLIFIELLIITLCDMDKYVASEITKREIDEYNRNNRVSLVTTVGNDDDQDDDKESRENSLV